jgi:NADPH-dependent 2,4-dienoyl-CoA reductase/sulfur reductase-like enzyme
MEYITIWMSKREKATSLYSINTTGRPSLDSADIVIVGNGIAGLTAAVEARRLAPDKRIVIITEQVHPTINTPSLKQFAIGKLEREQLLAYPVATERQERIHIVTTRVEEIHANSKYVTLSGNRGFGYGSLLIATGSTPQGLPENVPGRNFDGVLTLHRLQDYLDLRRRLSEVDEAVVIGGGVHAIETVMVLLHWGIRVHWLIRSKTFLPRMLDQPASEMVLERLRQSRAIVHTETEVIGIVGRMGSVIGVITNRQEMIPCQLVLTCTGTQALTTLARQSSIPLQHKRGILVDDQLRTNVPNIYAAGDVAALKNPQTQEYEPRAQWYAAVSQGRIAGAMLAGREDLAHQPFGVHWHATHLGTLSMLTVGTPLLQDEKVITLTDRSQGSYRRLAVAGDRLLGYLSLGPTQPDSLAIKRIVDEGHSVGAIMKALLKGNFDARQYLSHLRSRTAQGLLSSGKQRELTVNPVSQVKLLPLSAAQRSTSQSSHAMAASEAGQSPRATVKERITDSLTPTMEEATTEEISPFMGNLPLLDNPGKDEGVSPFTGNLPASLRPALVVEAVSAPPPITGRPKRGFWDYADPPIINRRQGTATGRIYNTRSLWSYNQQKGR